MLTWAVGPGWHEYGPLALKRTLGLVGNRKSMTPLARKDFSGAITRGSIQLRSTTVSPTSRSARRPCSFASAASARSMGSRVGSLLRRKVW